MTEKKTVRLRMGAIGTDSITGFTGKIVAKVVYITGCTQYELAPPVDKDGNFRKAIWFDEDRLIKGAKAKKPIGGPRTSHPPSRMG